MKRILLTGGGGYLGRHLLPVASKQFEARYTYFNRDPLNLPTGLQLDLRDRQAVLQFVFGTQPDVIIHTAGSNRSPDMESVICQGTANIVDAASAVNARLIHLSTDALFDGLNPPYRESDPPHPLHAYGRAKAEAERIVAAHDE